MPLGQRLLSLRGGRVQGSDNSQVDQSLRSFVLRHQVALAVWALEPALVGAQLFVLNVLRFKQDILGLVFNQRSQALFVEAMAALGHRNGFSLLEVHEAD